MTLETDKAVNMNDNTTKHMLCVPSGPAKQSVGTNTQTHTHTHTHTLLAVGVFVRGVIIHKCVSILDTINHEQHV